MKLTTAYVRFFRSFNFDYLRQDKDVDEFPWDMFREKFYPFVSVDIEADITTVVGANEAGKSQLITAIECLLGARSITPKDFCRYSPFFGVRGNMPLPEFGGLFTNLSVDEVATFQLATGLVPGEGFWFFRLAAGASVYVRAGSGWSTVEVGEATVQSLGLPVARRIDAGMTLPASVSLYDLVQGVPSPDRRDRTSWDRVHKDLKLQESIYSESTTTAQLLPVLGERTDVEEVHARSSLQLARDMFEKVAKVDSLAFQELLDASSDDDGYSAALAASITEALAISLNFPQWWSQDRDFALEVHKDGFFLVLTMRDRTGQTYTFDERSGGMKYFLSYFVQYQAYAPINDGRDEIILMDEPDAFLSAQGQQDLLRVFNGYAHPDRDAKPAQVLYVTHSPFLLDKNHPQRIRVLQKGLGEEGTRVVPKANTDKYEPLRSAFGSFHADTAFIGNCNLLVEGPADLILFSGITAAIRAEKFAGESLNLNDLTMVPVHGATQYRYTLHLTRGRDLDRPAVVVLLDADQAGRNAGVDLEKGYADSPILDKKFILSIGDLDLGQMALDVDEVHEPEDLVPASIARTAVLHFAADILSPDDLAVLASKLPDSVPIDRSKRLYDQMKKATLVASKTLQRPLDVGKIEFARAIADIAGDTQLDGHERLLGNFAALFSQLNRLIDEARFEHSKERTTQITKRLVERFRRDHRKRARKHTAATFLTEIEQQLPGASQEEERIRAEMRSIREDFKLDENPEQDVEDFEQLRERLKRLVHQAESA